MPQCIDPPGVPSLGRVWGVIPAAGLSRRMGQHKLLLDAGGWTVMHRLVDALLTGGVDGVHVLVREDDRPLHAELAATAACVHTVPSATPDMRSSVEQLLTRLAARVDPQPHDAWLLCPADHPVLQADVIRRLLETSATHPGAIVLPTHAGRRGHPTLFPWPLVEAVRRIPPGRGLNWLIAHPPAPIIETPCDDPSVLFDLDTPADYERLQALFRR
jgi:molybdenum cofactor cytidylyltransferase